MQISYTIIELIKKEIVKQSGREFWRTMFSPAGSFNYNKFAWYSVQYFPNPLPESGWKLHVSAHLHNAEEILKAVISDLIALKAHFKVPSCLNFLIFLSNPNLSKAQSGKFITIYPNSPAHAHAIAKKLHESTTHFSSPTIITDTPFAENSIIYYRYGGFTARYIQTLWGVLKAALLVNGVLQEDSKEPSATYGYENPFLLNINKPKYGCSSDNKCIESIHIIKYKCLSKNYRAKIFLCLDKKYNRRCIVKEVSANSGTDSLGNTTIKKVQYEKEILKKLEGYNIAPLFYYDYFDEKQNYCLVMEDISGEPLSFYLKRLLYQYKRISPYKAVKIAIQLAQQINIIHQQQILHGDIKLDNIILLDDGSIRVIDFDSACDFEYGRLTASAGTIGYKTINRRNGNSVCVRDDIYSYGACLYYLFTTIDPDENPLELEQFDINFQLLHPDTPKYLKNLIRGCLDGSIREFQEIIHILERKKNLSEAKLVLERTFSYEEKLHFLTEEIIARSYDKSLNYFEFSETITGNIKINDFKGLSGALFTLAVVNYQYNSDSVSFSINTCVNQLIKEEAAYNLIPGLYTGESGKALALLYSTPFSSQKGYSAALNFMSRANSLPLQSPDLYNGAAGCLRTNIIFFITTKNNDYLIAAKKIVQFLLASYQEGDILGWYNPSMNATTDNFILNKDEIFLGYSHGMAGIADTLLDYYLVTQDAAIADLLKKVMSYLLNEAKLILREKGIAWPAKRGGALTQPYWCHGAAGIGIFLSRMMYYHLWRTDLVLLNRIVESIFVCTQGGATLLCHGTLGSLEALIDLNYYYPSLLLDKKIKHFENIISHWIRQYINNGFKTQNSKINQYGYLNGILGYLVVYMRLINMKIPNPTSIEYAYYLNELQS